MELTSRFPLDIGKELPRAKTLLADGLRLLWIKIGYWKKLNRDREELEQAGSAVVSTYPVTTI